MKLLTLPFPCLDQRWEEVGSALYAKCARNKWKEICRKVKYSCCLPFYATLLHVGFSGIERLQVVQTAIGCFYVSGIDRQQSGEAATGYVL